MKNGVLMIAGGISFLIGCGVDPNKKALVDGLDGLSQISAFVPSDLRNDADLAPFVSDFVQLAHHYGYSSVSANQAYVQFGDTSSAGSSVIGLCDRQVAYRRVLINSSFFYNSSNDVYTKRSLLFHELAHCLLNRKHRSDRYTGSPAISGLDVNWPLSIMYPSIVKSYKYGTLGWMPAFHQIDNPDAYNHWIDELFDSAYYNDWPMGSSAGANDDGALQNESEEVSEAHGCAMIKDPETGKINAIEFPSSLLAPKAEE